MIDGYQDSKIGKFPNDWNVTQIQDVLLEYQNGYAFSAKGYVEEGISIISMAMISLKGRFQFDELKCKKWDSKEELSLERYILKKGELIIAMTDVTPNKDLIGKMAVINIDGKFLLNQRVGWLKLNKKIIDTTYLSYIGNSENWLKNCRSMASQGAQANIGTKQIVESYIPLPPLSEQQKIAEILSTVDDKIEVIDQQIIETQALKKGLMQRLLTKGIGHTEFKDSPLGMIPESWDVIELDKLVNPKRPIRYGIVQTGEYIENGIPCIRVVDFNNREFSKQKMITTTTEISNSYKTTILEEGDIVFPLRGRIGDVKLVNENAIGANLTRGVALISNSEKINPAYLYWQIRSNSVKKLIELEINGTTLKEVPIGGLKKILIPIASLEEQFKISTILNCVEDKLSVLEGKKNHYHELKQGLMQQLLTGKIRVKV